jgi:uncharacterized membrane protein
MVTLMVNQSLFCHGQEVENPRFPNKLRKRVLSLSTLSAFNAPPGNIFVLMFVKGWIDSSVSAAGRMK